MTSVKGKIKIKEYQYSPKGIANLRPSRVPTKWCYSWQTLRVYRPIGELKRSKCSQTWFVGTIIASLTIDHLIYPSVVVALRIELPLRCFEYG